jgi:sulfatase maturation enzyme AslB (radical SAM superfamily)
MRHPLFFVEPTNRCNLRCSMCPSNREMTRRRGDIDPALFERIVDEIVQHSGERAVLNLWGWGEPTLHNDFAGLVKTAAVRGLVVNVSTNLELTSTVEAAETLCKTGATALIVGLDGITASSHNQYRQGGNVSRVMKNIEQLISVRTRLGLELPYVVVTSLLTMQALSEWDDLVIFCRRVGVDAILAKHPNLWRGAKTERRINSLYEKFMSGSSSKGRYILDSQTGQLTSAGGPCPFSDNNGVVLWNGDVTTCCFDYDGVVAVGNVDNAGGLFKILNSSLWQSVSKEMSEKALSICATCDSCGPRRRILLLREDLHGSRFLSFC